MADLNDFFIFDETPAGQPAKKAKPLLQSKTEWSRTYRLANGMSVEIKLSDELDRIDVYDASGIRIGEFEFKSLSDEGGEGYLLARAYLDLNSASYKGMGIGRTALKYFKEASGELIFARPDDRQRRDDGSQLTGDAPGFVAALIEEGVIEKERIE